MNDTDLANALVELGILRHWNLDPKRGSVLADETCPRYELSAEQIVSDWRVAGACLEKWEPRSYARWLLSEASTVLAKTLRDPRAINLAFVEAMSDG